MTSTTVKLCDYVAIGIAAAALLWRVASAFAN